ncbi:hypothetical protein AaE_000053 [Aphanomyces astaci]|uniref:P-type ATPase C-terminal domain-containing protein n=1 Tax=Aphanomyces astaci TaxID=112090 RepID=A0A6A5AWU4_APHAT|nr:hypothetical protein AaE_000053 [Aphanomyces astaci]
MKIETARMEYDVLYVLAFNSNRKRMSVIVRDRQTNAIRLICKGADCVILDRCTHFGSQSKGAIETHLKDFAGEGLRTLCYADRVLDEVTFDKWCKSYREAELAMKCREEAMEAMAGEIEQNMTFLATTAIEDKLQDGVPDTIARLLRADLKIWVLTGDKVETAVEIGRSCRVISKDMVEMHLEGTTVPAMAKSLVTLASTPTLKPRALIIDGFSLSFALMPSNRQNFLAFATQCAAVIVCRMSPLQKALVVELVKDGVGCVTMAVYVLTYFSSLYIAAFNLCFTFLPVVARAIVEKTLPDHISTQFPELYHIGHTKVSFSLATVASVGAIGVFHAVVLTLVPLYFLDHHQGVLHVDQFADGVATYIGIMFVTSITISLQTKYASYVEPKTLGLF